MARFAELEVLAPVAWWPQTALRARCYESVPRLDAHQGLPVHHPRFPALPPLLATAEPLLLALSSAAATVALRRTFPFDVVHVHGVWPDGVAAAALARLVGAPFCVKVGTHDARIVAQGRGRRALVRWTLGRAALVITVSQEARDWVVDLGVPEHLVAVVPDGVDVDRFRPLEREAARACLGIPSQARVVLSVGRLHRSKRFPDLVDALARLAQGDPDLRLVIVGEPDAKADATPDIRAAIARSRLHGRVTLTGGRSPGEMVWWYNAADLLWLPATHGAGKVTLEAMACGLPCITESSGAVTAPDVDALSRAIEDALQRKWDRDQLAQQAQSRGWDIIAREYCERLADVGRLQAAMA